MVLATPARSGKSSSLADATGDSPSGRRGAGKFLLDGLLTYGTEILSSALLFVNGVLLARYLGPDGRGQYAILILVPLTCYAVGHLGFFQGLVHGSIRERDTLPVRALHALLMAGTLGSALMVIAFLVFRSGWLEQFEVASPLALALAVAGLPAILLNHFAQAIMLGRDDLVRRNVLRLLEPLGYFVGTVVLLVALRRGVTGAMGAWIGSYWCAGLVSLYWLVPLAAQVRFRPDWKRLLQDLRFGIASYGGAVAIFLLHRQDQALVAYFLDEADVGHYAVAYSLIMMMGILPNAIQAAFLPKVTLAWYDEGGSEAMTPFVCRVMTAISAVLGLGAAALIWPLLRWFYGEAFLPAAWPFIVLLPGVVVLAGLSALHSAMQARSAQRWVSIGAALALVVNVLLDLWWIPRFGIVGAAAASTVAYLAMVALVARAFLAIDRHVTIGDLAILKREDLAMIRRGLGPIVARVRARLRRENGRD